MSQDASPPRRVPASLHEALAQAARDYQPTPAEVVAALGGPDPASVELAEILNRWKGSTREIDVLDGWACVLCGDDEGSMIPVGHGPFGQLFAHLECWPTTATSCHASTRRQ